MQPNVLFVKRIHTALACVLLSAVLAVDTARGETASATEPQGKPLVSSGCEPDCPPYCFVNTNRQADGFSVELFRAALKAVGRDVDFKTSLLPELKQSLANGRLQALPLMERTPENEAVYDFTFPYLTLHGAIVVRQTSRNISSLEDLKGRQVAVLQGDTAEKYLRQAGIDAVIVPRPSYETALRELAAGKYDAVVIQKLQAFQLIKKAGLKNLTTVGPPLKDLAQRFCFATRKGDQNLLAALNEGLSLVMSDDTFRALCAKWLSPIETLGRRKSRIVVGGDSHCPPYEFLDQNGQPAGFYVDLTRAIARRMGLSVDIRLGTSGNVRKALSEGELDLAQGLFFSAESDQLFEFSPPLAAVQYALVVRDSPQEHTSTKTLAGKTILVMAGDIMEDWALKRDYMGYVKPLVTVPSQEDALRLLAAGKGDCTLVAKLPALYWIGKNGWKNLKVSNDSVLSSEVCYAVLHGHGDVLSPFSEGLAALKSTGEFRKIQAKWLGPYEAETVSASLRTYGTYALVIISLLIFLLGGALLWTRSLRRQVAERTQSLTAGISELKRVELEREVTVNFLRLVNETAGTAELIRKSVLFFQKNASCDAVGLRLREGDDFPYYGTSGFPPDFVAAENHLCQRDLAGQLVRDSAGAPVIECMCGNVLCGRVDPSKPFFTAHGSFWTNSTTALRGSMTEADRQTRTRDRCTGEGYESVALIPLHFGEDRLGLLQLNSRTINVFSLQTIELWERLADNLAVALSHASTQESLRESEERLRTLGDNIPGGALYQLLVSSDGKARYTYLSAGIERIFGISAESVLADPTAFWQLIVEEDRLRIDEAQQRSARDMALFECEFRQRTRTGEIKWFQARSIPRKLEDGSLLWDGVIADINERKRSEAERERLMAAIGQSSEVVVITDSAGMIQYVNPAFERITGYTRAEVAGQNTRILKSGQHDEAFYSNLWRTLTQGQTWSGRIVNKRKDGALYTEEATISPVRDTSGQTVNYVAVKRDITENLQLATQLQQAQKMDSVGRLAGGVAHDFNNMLAVILGNTELALNQTDPTQPLFADLQEIRKAAERSADLTKQLLAFARKQAVAPKVLDLNDTVVMMLKMLRRLIGENIELAWQPGTEDATVKIDPSQIDQILVNLAVNARDAIGGVGDITLATGNMTFDQDFCAKNADAVPGDYVMLAFSDTGCGMDKVTLEHIFEPFFTTKNVGKGTGLGLATVYGIVKQNRGVITVSSELGQGTTFRIYLPKHLEQIGQAQAKEPLEAQSPNHETVLLVEDEPAVLKLGKRMLESLGYRVQTASLPSEAIAWAETQTGDIHLLLTDVIMPEMTGWDLAKWIRLLYPEIGLLFMSGYTSDAITQHEMLSSGARLIQKPFTKKDLAAKVAETLKRA